MNKILRYTLLTLALLTLALSASAQRTRSGQMFVDASFGWPMEMRVGTGGYLIPGFWDAGAEAMRMTKLLRRDGEVMDLRLEVWQLKAYGGFRYRLIPTRSRVFNVYVGGDAWVGVEAFDPFKRLPDDIIFNVSTKPSFVFGVTPALEMELFAGNHFAFVFGGRADLAFMSRIKMFTYHGYGGIRVAF